MDEYSSLLLTLRAEDPEDSKRLLLVVLLGLLAAIESQTLAPNEIGAAFTWPRCQRMLKESVNDDRYIDLVEEVTQVSDVMRLWPDRIDSIVAGTRQRVLQELAKLGGRTNTRAWPETRLDQKATWQQ